MTEIKPWQDRVKPGAFTGVKMEAMLAEIAELRAALAKSQPVEQGKPVTPFCMHWVDRWGCNHYVDQKEPHPANATPLFTHPVRPMSDAPKIYSRCSNTLRLLGKPYPRTCQECGLGPCKDPIKGATE